MGPGIPFKRGTLTFCGAVPGPRNTISWRSQYHIPGQWPLQGGDPRSGCEWTLTARSAVLGKPLLSSLRFKTGRQPGTWGHCRASRAGHHIFDGPEHNPAPGAHTATGPSPRAAAPPPLPVGRSRAPTPPRRRGSCCGERPSLPSAGSGATFPFRLRVPERSGRPDPGAEQWRR